MDQRHTAKLGVASIVAAALATTTLGTGAAQAHQPAPKPGNKSLAAVLGADSGFDHNWKDFDIVEKAVLTVLDAKPDSPVKLLTRGKKRATAFIPTDAAFRRLVKDLTGTAPKTEKATFKAVASVADADILEAVLLYHVVAGKTLTAKKVLARDGKDVTTALGSTFRVSVKGKKVVLVDADKDDANPRVVALDISKGNKQVAHGINRVLRPIDL